MTDRSVSVPMTLSDHERPMNYFFRPFFITLVGEPRHCICTNASRGLPATAEFLVSIEYIYM